MHLFGYWIRSANRLTYKGVILLNETTEETTDHIKIMSNL